MLCGYSVELDLGKIMCEPPVGRVEGYRLALGWVLDSRRPLAAPFVFRRLKVDYGLYGPLEFRV